MQIFVIGFALTKQDKWKENNIGLDVELPVKWQKYVKQYEDAKSKYRPCLSPGLNSPELNRAIDNNLAPSDDFTSSDRRVSCFYEDVINKDLDIFKEKIRYTLYIRNLTNVILVIKYIL